MSAPQQEEFKPDPIDSGFKALPERIRTEREDRLAQRGKILRFGVHFLDRALRGIFPNDLILLGAWTGMGKTALSTLIARANSAAGKRVHYFALEAEDREIERRMKYMLITDMIFSRPMPREILDRMNYLDWLAGDLDDITARFEPAAELALVQEYKTLHTLYRTRDFTVDDLDRAMLEVQDSTDLYIIDHIHFVDSPDEMNENRGYKIVIKKIRDLALRIGKPVVVVAHLRKKDGRSKPMIVPTIDDFHGTSDIPKIATKAIMLAPAFDRATGNNSMWATYISVAKCRPEGSRSRYVGLVTFNSRMSAYEKQFVLGRVSGGGEKFDTIDKTEIPAWAR